MKKKVYTLSGPSEDVEETPSGCFGLVPPTHVDYKNLNSFGKLKVL